MTESFLVGCTVSVLIALGIFLLGFLLAFAVFELFDYLFENKEEDDIF